MRSPSFFLSDDLAEYVRSHSEAIDPLDLELIDETSLLPNAGMQISPEQGKFLAFLVQISGARQVLELGTFTGYSTLCMARAMAPGGRIIACDVSEEWTKTARRYWERAGVADRIDLRIGPATGTLAAMPPEPLFDLAFIDADKEGYPAYLKAVVPRLRAGGLLVADNVLWSGRVVDPSSQDESVAALRRFNQMAVADPRIETVVLPVFDGLTLAIRR